MTDSERRAALAGVMGDPVLHSRSPLIFRKWFADHGIAGDYVRLRVAAEHFEAAFRGLAVAGFRGVNVTIPHKHAALALADEASEAARAIGAANTITFSGDGGIHADNTDGYGFFENLCSGAPGWSPGAAPALVLGAGGAARAVIHALLAGGVPEVRLTNRTRARAEELADHFGAGVTVVDWAERSAAADGAGLVVNTTSLGMTGQPPLEISLDAAKGAVVNDLVYAPLETDLLAEARRRGLTAVDGLGMLLHQARPGFRKWFGADPAVDEALRAQVLQG